MSARRGGRRGRDQQTLGQDFEPEHPDVADAAADYQRKKLERMDLLKEEVAARGVLLDLMRKHKLTRYETEDLLVLVVPAGPDKVKVKSKKGGEPDDGDE